MCTPMCSLPDARHCKISAISASSSSSPPATAFRATWQRMANTASPSRNCRAAPTGARTAGAAGDSVCACDGACACASAAEDAGGGEQSVDFLAGFVEVGIGVEDSDNNFEEEEEAVEDEARVCSGCAATGAGAGAGAGASTGAADVDGDDAVG